ncbi:WD repeat-containing protein 61 [Irpex rosettiformis]|uniref:WD repeat-containing protein 61 n=1 Tax=Irpex rosettiformis TaxID=378272 RepID=A0ACB8U519_9APHY|nr:WD repeat-containing protein 61 [Irpex rosettiformis]
MSLAFLHVTDGAEPHADSIWSVAWTPQDQVFTASADGSLKQWNPTSGQVSHSQPPHSLGIVSMSTDSNGKKVLWNTLEGLTSLWDLDSGEVAGKWESYVRGSEGGEPAWSVSLHPSGSTFAATGGSGNITIHSAESSSFGERKATLPSGRTKFGLCTKYSPDGTRVAMSSETGQIYIFDVAAEKLISTYTSHAMAVRSFAWSPDSQLLVSASEDKRLIMHDVRHSPSGKPGSGAVATLSGHTSWVLCADVSPDGRFVLSGSADKTMRIWDLSTRTSVSTVQDTGEVWSVSWRPKPAQHGSSGEFVSGGEDGVVRWWRSAGASG